MCFSETLVSSPPPQRRKETLKIVVSKLAEEEEEKKECMHAHQAFHLGSFPHLVKYNKDCIPANRIWKFG